MCQSLLALVTTGRDDHWLRPATGNLDEEEAHQEDGQSDADSTAVHARRLSRVVQTGVGTDATRRRLGLRRSGGLDHRRLGRLRGLVHHRRLHNHRRLDHDRRLDDHRWGGDTGLAVVGVGLRELHARCGLVAIVDRHRLGERTSGPGALVDLGGLLGRHDGRTHRVVVGTGNASLRTVGDRELLVARRRRGGRALLIRCRTRRVGSRNLDPCRPCTRLVGSAVPDVGARALLRPDRNRVGGAVGLALLRAGLSVVGRHGDGIPDTA